VSFGVYARRVRDAGLPDGRRYSALRCTVGCYCPLGFGATWAYLGGAAGIEWPRPRGAAELLRMLGILETSREVAIAETTDFAAVRRTEKAAGRRVPREADLARLRGPRWPTRTEPSLRGLIAAVADGYDRLHAAGDTAAPELRLLHAELTPHARHFLSASGRLDSAARADLASLVTEHEFNGPWRAFARLLRYAAETQGRSPTSQ
jgi:hypothetical protein